MNVTCPASHHHTVSPQAPFPSAKSRTLMAAIAAGQGREALVRAIRSTPIIDNHAHPLLKRDALGRHPLLSIATEAHGDALHTSKDGLAHYRAVKQLSEILGCDRTWEAVAAAIEQRRQSDYDAWIATCLFGIQCVLVDDGLDGTGEAEPYSHFDKFTSSAAKRIVRIEHVAAPLIEAACTTCNSAKEAYREFGRTFEQSILHAISDPEVVGFKSVICYRTGLAIPRTPNAEQAISAFEGIFEQRRAPGAEAFARVDHPGLNEHLVHFVAGLVKTSHGNKPIQFHTGLGDNDITLTTSSPSHLQAFIEEYPTTGYLAAMYANVHADIGEVFPFLSRDGQENVVRHILELCPASKILWSTDGHWFPETYFLAVTQMREVFETVLCDYVHKGDLSWAQAIRVVEDLLFHNANRLYNLKLEMHPQASPDLVVRGTTPPSAILQLDDSVQFLRVCWNDMTATPRMRAVPMRRVQSLLQGKEGLSFGITKACLGMTQTGARALRVGPRVGHATVMADFREQDGSVVPLCPRSALQRAARMAALEGLTFEIGFEVEVVILGVADSGYEPLRGVGHQWCIARAMDHEVVATVIETAIEQLEAAGVFVEMVHAESASGQYEIILPKSTPLEAVDTLLFARDVISCCATARGYKATLHPKPFADDCGTGATFTSIAAFTYSNPASYERVRDGWWAGGTWITWGTQNREAPLRKIDGSHWELKCVDGLANPYLAMSAILLAGLDGVRSQTPLRWSDCTEEPHTLSDEEREQFGVTEKFPASLTEAFAALRKDTTLRGLARRGAGGQVPSGQGD
ncbi:hypothetical protein ACCO45_009740 [Purpureocillium lilacinum]|uniref:Uncharacterized protein n=1 Tax=Purpureocillium lilacinum TaxID=33203 RepID=A0ACC4DMV7_PURLI